MTIGRNLAFFIAGFALAVACSSMSQSYVGIAGGQSRAAIQGADQSCQGCTLNEVDGTSEVYKLFAGYRSGKWGLEGGGGTLSHYSSHRVGPTSDTPHRDIHQEIDTTHLYLQGMRYVELTSGVEAFGSFGLMRVRMKNHEWGCNSGTPCTFVEQVNYDARTRPFIGLGVSAPITPAASLRFELTHVRYVAVSHWTLEQNVTAGWLGLMVKL